MHQIPTLILSLWMLISLNNSAWATLPPSAPTTTPQVAGQAVQRFKLAEDVSVEDAVESMKLRANQRNFKLVAELPLSEQVKSMGQPSRYMHILAFCDALIASKMVNHNPLFAAFLPCRIAVIQDAAGQGWLVTMNIDQVLGGVNLPAELHPLAKQVRDTMYSIIDAGVNGDL